MRVCLSDFSSSNFSGTYFEQILKEVFEIKGKWLQTELWQVPLFITKFLSLLCLACLVILYFMPDIVYESSTQVPDDISHQREAAFLSWAH